MPKDNWISNQDKFQLRPILIRLGNDPRTLLQNEMGKVEAQREEEQLLNTFPRSNVYRANPDFGWENV